MAVEVQLLPLLPPQTMYYYLFLFLRPCSIPRTLYYSPDPVLLLIPLPLNESNLRRPPPWTLIKDARAPFDFSFPLFLLHPLPTTFSPYFRKYF